MYLRKMLPNYVQNHNPEIKMNIKQKLLTLGLTLDTTSGHLNYVENFSPLQLNYELVFIRH
ncbi:MAG: hypothetical protein JO131_04870, partial [Gammaproteobacteria bacterium]|nr:hypothetical protein [Gammaproteobacteria bacterium]